MSPQYRAGLSSECKEEWEFMATIQIGSRESVDGKYERDQVIIVELI